MILTLIEVYLVPVTLLLMIVLLIGMLGFVICIGIQEAVRFFKK